MENVEGYCSNDVCYLTNEKNCCYECDKKEACENWCKRRDKNEGACSNYIYEKN